ncbi:MBOAT family protein [Butyrivibrio sp. INlla16]|uniref:MBOAT family O-acyltransferase n=1 Tax=Butyrivibrio sp. INlla16 TaxID=1520807 RepID=UPI000886F88E|nr:MBOAT family O-acyltransferase [Butyrivibrio sp. INlla16]SDB61567.1 D-alanyl-lipoteichoic acid acyltransferase DltB, MBOAT superfamily [Butyrivibrio sp. INlla16]
MQFVSPKFLLFLLITISVYFVLPKKIRYIWLLAASWGFYYKLSGKLLLLLIAVSVITYVAGILMGRSDTSGENRKGKKPVLVTGIVLLLLVLGYFKYTGFLLETVKSLQDALGIEPLGIVAEIALPVGISFYIFQAIGYLVDTYRGKILAQKNFLRLALFISFFPEVMSGPIERAGNMIPQFENPKDFSYENMREGLLLMLWGYFQKIIIADRLAPLVDHIYSSYSNYTGTLLFLATIFYTLEIYCDFAGYSNIAIGSAKILGIDIMKNFEQPYLSRSIAEFWRRWHISLSSWLRDYIYIPLGGNRKGYVRKLINICIVFALSGLWHGAAWTFVFWGLLHGLYQVIGIITKPLKENLTAKLNIDPQGLALRLVNIVVTFILVNIGWIFFRAPSFKVARYVLTNMWKFKPWVLFDGTLFNLGLPEADIRLLGVSIIVLAIVDVLNYKGIVVRKALTNQALWIRWIVYFAAVLFIVTCGVWGPGYDAASFIYSSF